MNQDKKQLIEEQIGKINEVLAVLGNDFAKETEEEINFLNIVKANLQEVANQK